MWVKPGITVAACSSARSRNAAISPFSASATRRNSFFTHSRKSTATWSLRERAVCSLPAAGPISSASRASTFMWMSSSFSEKANLPLSISARIVFSPLAIFFWSARLMMPCSASISECAIEPLMSSA